MAVTDADRQRVLDSLTQPRTVTQGGMTVTHRSADEAEKALGILSRENARATTSSRPHAGRTLRAYQSDRGY